MFIRKGSVKIATPWLPFCSHGLMGTQENQLSSCPRSVALQHGLQWYLEMSAHLLRVQVGGPGLAVMDDPKRGIQFGAEGLSIPLTAGSSQGRAAKCRLGTYYAKNPTLSEGGRSLFAKGESLKGTELVSLKVDCMCTCNVYSDTSPFCHCIQHSMFNGKHAH